MKNEAGAIELISKGNNVLPSRAAVEKRAKKVSDLLDPKGQFSVTARRNNIGGILNNDTNPQIVYLFNGNNTYADEIKAAEGRYMNKGAKFKYKELTSDSVWDYIGQRSTESLRSELLNKTLSFVQEMNLFGGTDIHTILGNVSQNHRIYGRVANLLTGTRDAIRSELPAMVSLKNNEQFVPHQHLKLIVLAQHDRINENNIINKMQQFHPDSEEYLQLPSLGNTIVVYQIYSMMGNVNGVSRHFNPLLHLSYQEQVLHDLKHSYDNGQYDPAKRLPYIDMETLLDTEHINIK